MSEDNFTYIKYLEFIAPMMNNLVFDPLANCFYDVMSDALVWRDEIPAVFPPKSWALRFLFRYRTSLIVSKPDVNYEKFWKIAETYCPKWPGMKEDRRSISMQKTFLTLKQQFKANSGSDA